MHDPSNHFAEQRLPNQSPKGAETLLAALLDNVPDAIFFKDLQSRFTCVSRAMVERTSIKSREEILGKTDFDLFDEEHARKAFEDEQAIVRTGEPFFNKIEKEIWPDGSISWVSTSKMPLYDENGAIIGTFGISSDITRRMSAELKLKDTQKELLEASRLAGIAEISSGILHNIGNGLNSVNTTGNVLSERLANSRVANLVKIAEMIRSNKDNIAQYISEDPKGSKIPEYLTQLSDILQSEQEFLKEEVQQLQKYVEHLKAIVAMQQNYSRTSSLIDRVAPEELMEEALKISEISLTRHGIDVLRDFKQVPIIDVSRHKVLQILVNFIRNAKYAIDETGREDKLILVGLQSTEDGNVAFSVRDNGVGIDPEVLPKLFQFGFTTREQGHGFGLHACANTAKELKARIKVDSEGKEKGACFTLVVPVQPQ
ncbi:MAG: PAS domain-containing protein [Opitutales bacterium]|nr:PAS domain-containing protein [Opitutales bacterium]